MGKLNLKDVKRETELYEVLVERVPKQMELLERQLKWQWRLLAFAIIALTILGIIGVIK